MDGYLKQNLFFFALSSLLTFYIFLRSRRDIITAWNRECLADVFGSDWPAEVRSVLESEAERLKEKKSLFLFFLPVPLFALAFLFSSNTEKAALAQFQRFSVELASVAGNGMVPFNLFQYQMAITGLVVGGAAAIIFIQLRKRDYACPWAKWYYRTYAHVPEIHSKIHQLFLDKGFTWDAQRKMFKCRSRKAGWRFIGEDFRI